MKLQPTGRARRCRIGGLVGIEFDLPFKLPYDWQTILRFYQTHSIPGLERVTENSFARSFRIDNLIGFVSVAAMSGARHLTVRIVPENPEVSLAVVGRVRKMFDLDCDPMVVAKSFQRIPLLASLCRRRPGLRLPRGWDPFETAICSILGQLVSAPQRAHLIGQLMDNYGIDIVHPLSKENTRLFPTAEVLATVDLSAVKTTIARREAIREFSRRVLAGAISLSEDQEAAAFRRALLAVRGLGPWSAEYISLRAIGDTDAFPKTDLILRRVLQLHPNLDLATVKPWRSYAAIYFWQEFAHSLSKGKKGRNHDALLQRNRIAGRQAQTGRKRRRLGRGAVGKRAAKPGET
jgi:AraC family transcriptional regulator of adaptative response / DNA-3-methyladenine glycosylase II